MKKDEKDAKQRQITTHRRNARWTLIIGIPLFLIAPFLLTALSHFKWANFTHTGEIGDTIGGITAPIVNLISAILIYLSFRQQLLANEIQIDLVNAEKDKDISRSEKELLIFHYAEIKESISSVKYESALFQTRGSHTFIGTEAFEIFIKELSSIKNYDAHQFWFTIELVLIDIETFLDFLTRSEYLDAGDKQFFGFRLHTLFFHKILIPLGGIDELSNDFIKGVKIRNRIQQISKALETYDRE
ncbi:MAG: hypothetical protein SFY56_00375 [Bacteroidota bacterium]|nr:hypothetical protein [Bacteroidota bacterium]